MRRITSSLLGEQYDCFAHKSGLPIYVFPKKMTTAFCCFAVRYGSLDGRFTSDGEADARCVPDGVAHFLEHKLFENADGSDSFARFAALGADANAYTTYNRTVYLFSCTENLEASLAELLTFVTHPHFTKRSVQKEQGIIAEEIKMYEDSPWDRCMQLLTEALYWQHPVRKNICGTAESIKRITPELLYDCHRAFYTPNNMALVVCGDVQSERIAKIVDEVLPSHFVPRKVERSYGTEPREVRLPYAEIEMQVAKPLFSIGVKDDPPADLPPAEKLKRELAMDLLDEILFSRSGAFYNDLFEAGKLTSSFAAGYSSAEDFAFHCISGESDDPEEILRRLKDYLQTVRENGIPQEDFLRCRRVLYADEIRAYDSTEEIATRLLSFVFDGAEIFSCPEILQSITKEYLEQLLQTAFADECFSLAVVRPFGSRKKGT